MNLRRGLFILLSSAILAFGGCQEPQHRPPAVAFDEQVIAIEELAVRLGLRVAERDDAFVVLKNTANTVLIFTHSDGRFFVNGKPIGDVGAVKRIGHVVYVPDTLVSAIRPHLRIPGPEPPPVVPRRKTATVVIDPGHGGKDPGTTVAATHEKHIVLQVALKIAALLEQQGVTVVMTRRDDRFIELEERADLANRRNPDLFVSIHADSAPDRSVSGFTLYVAPDASRQAHKAAKSISAAMARTGSDTRGIRDAEYKVLMWTRCPAVLVELGYLSNAADARRLQDAAHQNRLAQAIADGILDCLP
jgi:N-acetylmuramoyl-L-alanine amidase